MMVSSNFRFIDGHVFSEQSRNAKFPKNADRVLKNKFNKIIAKDTLTKKSEFMEKTYSFKIICTTKLCINF